MDEGNGSVHPELTNYGDAGRDASSVFAAEVLSDD